MDYRDELMARCKEGAIVRVDNILYQVSYIHFLNSPEAVMMLHKGMINDWYKVTLITDVFCKDNNDL